MHGPHEIIHFNWTTNKCKITLKKLPLPGLWYVCPTPL